MPTSTLAMDRLLNRARPTRRRQPAPWDMGHGHSMALAWAMNGMGIDMGRGQGKAGQMYSTYSLHPSIPIHPGISHNHKMTAFKQPFPPYSNPGRRAPPGRVGVELRFFRRPEWYWREPARDPRPSGIRKLRRGVPFDEPQLAP